MTKTRSCFLVALILVLAASGGRDARAVVLAPGDIVAIGTYEDGTASVVRIDPWSGVETAIVSGPAVGSPRGLAIEPGGTLVGIVSSGTYSSCPTSPYALVRMDPASETVTWLNCIPNASAASIAVDPDNGDLFVAVPEPYPSAIWRYNPAGGQNGYLYGGNGYYFLRPRGLLVRSGTLYAIGDSVFAGSSVDEWSPQFGHFNWFGGTISQGADLAPADENSFYAAAAGKIVRVASAPDPPVVVTNISASRIAREDDGSILAYGTGSRRMDRVDPLTGSSVTVWPSSLSASPSGFLLADFGVIPGSRVACNDGVDNDGDGLTDSPADPACKTVASTRENSKCQDGIDNDFDGALDFDGGASVNGGIPLGSPDEQCAGKPWRNTAEAAGCGLGVELLGLVALMRRMKRVRSGDV